MKNSIKIKLNIIRLLCIISLIVTGLSIRSTYAKYYENVATNYNINIKRWLIKVKNEDIIEKQDFSEDLTPTFVANQYMNPNVWVPTAQAYIEFDIDYKEVDVAFNLNLALEKMGTENEKLKDLKILKVVTVTGTTTETETEITLPYNVTVDGVAEANKVMKVRMYLEWNDDEETEEMSDIDDTNYQKNYDKTKYKVTATFEQYNVSG